MPPGDPAAPTTGAGETDGGRAPSWWPLVNAFAELSQELLAEHDEQALHELVCRRVTVVLPASDFCGITLRRRRGRLESVAVTDPLAEQADELQYRLGEGPCVDAAREEEHYLVTDLASDPRWPSWAARATELGIRSLVSVRLPSDTLHERHEALGALNLYSGRPGAFGAEHLRVAQVYARHAGNALAAARQHTGLQHAVHARHLVGAAQGVLRQRYGLDLDTAFDVLSRLSSERNVKLRDLAAQVVAERGLPGDGPAAGAVPDAAPGEVPAAAEPGSAGRSGDAPHVPLQQLPPSASPSDLAGPGAVPLGDEAARG